MGLFDAIAGITGAATNILNFSEQKKQNAWMREAQQTTWDREDNAVQRRAADMKAAGINPLLAAGSPAQASSPVQIGAPQMENTGFDKALVAMNLMAQKKNIGLTTAQELKTKEEIENAKKTGFLITRQEEKTIAETIEAQARTVNYMESANLTRHNLQKAQERGLPTDARGTSVDILNALDALKARGPDALRELPLLAQEIAKALYGQGGVLRSALGGVFGKLIPGGKR